MKVDKKFIKAQKRKKKLEARRIKQVQFLQWAEFMRNFLPEHVESNIEFRKIHFNRKLFKMNIEEFAKENAPIPMSASSEVREIIQQMPVA